MQVHLVIVASTHCQSIWTPTFANDREQDYIKLQRRKPKLMFSLKI